MPSFRKKPVVIEAWKAKDLFQAARDNWYALPPCIINAYDHGNIVFMGDGTITIRTPEGILTAQVNDWVIRGTGGELYPCKPERFEEIYEPAD